MADEPVGFVAEAGLARDCAALAAANVDAHHAPHRFPATQPTTTTAATTTATTENTTPTKAAPSSLLSQVSKPSASSTRYSQTERPRLQARVCSSGVQEVMRRCTAGITGHRPRSAG